MILDDDSIMQFGNYEGYKLEDIPASYLLWLWSQDWFQNSVNPFRSGLRNYIQENIDVLEKQRNEEKDEYWRSRNSD